MIKVASVDENFMAFMVIKVLFSGFCICDLDLRDESTVNFLIFFYLFIKVKPSSKLDACLSKIEEIANRLKSAVIGKDSELDRLLRLSEISKASTLASSVLKSANEKTECGKTLNQDTKELV